jgi:hypothetical protein
MITPKYMPMDEATHPLLNHALYAQAERAALAVFSSTAGVPYARRMRLMDKAAAAVFRRAGTRTDVAGLYACSITADILERAHRLRHAGRDHMDN